MSVLTKTRILARIYEEPEPLRRLTVTPLKPSQVGGASIDLRLGASFIMHKLANVTHIDPAAPGMPAGAPDVEESVSIADGKYLVLHPRQFVVGTTLEYLGVPYDVMAYVSGRSSWGRLGLIVQTAGGVHPGFRGVLALELTNVGEVPILLRANDAVAQIFLHDADEEDPSGEDHTAFLGSVRPTRAVIPLSGG